MKEYLALFVILLSMTACAISCAKSAGLYDPDASYREDYKDNLQNNFKESVEKYCNDNC